MQLLLYLYKVQLFEWLYRQFEVANICRISCKSGLSEGKDNIILCAVISLLHLKSGTHFFTMLFHGVSLNPPVLFNLIILMFLVKNKWYILDDYKSIKNTHIITKYCVISFYQLKFLWTYKFWTSIFLTITNTQMKHIVQFRF